MPVCHDPAPRIVRILTEFQGLTYTLWVRMFTKRQIVWVPAFLACEIGLFLGGCSQWLNSPLGALARSPHHEATAASSSDVGLSRQSTGTTSNNNLQIVGLAFDVIRIDLPLDDIQHSRKVWNHVDEMRIDSALSARLARNGIRCGAAAADAWPAIQAIAELAEAQVRRNRLTPSRGAPLVIEIDRVGENESIFTFDPRGGLSGKTFSGGRKLIVVDYDYHPGLGGSCDLRVGFEIRRDLGEMTWETRNGVIRQVPALDRHVFSDIRAELSLKTGELLLIGLSDSSSTRFILGSRFLTMQKEGRRFETLLCLKPMTFTVKN